MQGYLTHPSAMDAMLNTLLQRITECLYEMQGLANNMDSLNVTKPSIPLAKSSVTFLAEQYTYIHLPVFYNIDSISSVKAFRKQLQYSGIIISFVL
jgi:hypothetical protein